MAHSLVGLKLRMLGSRELGDMADHKIPLVGSLGG